MATSPISPKVPVKQSGATITMNPVHRQMNYFSVTEDELESLYTAGNYKTLDVSMFSLAFGSAIALGLTMATVDIADAKVYATIASALIVSVVGGVYFLWRAIIAWRSAARTFKSIKDTARAAP
jgi:hypothetical protein